MCVTKGVVMETIKERAKFVFDELSDDVSIQEILQELAFQLMIDQGIIDDDSTKRPRIPLLGGGRTASGFE